MNTEITKIIIITITRIIIVTISRITNVSISRCIIITFTCINYFCNYES